jgi:serine phosphatase RsbU (regulator of sigma subunit)
MVHRRGSLAITAAAVVSYDISNKIFYYSYTGRPPVLAWRSGGPWLPLVLKTPAGKGNLPLGVFRSVRYYEGEDRVQTGERILLCTDALSEAMSPESREEFGEKEFRVLLEARAEVELATLTGIPWSRPLPLHEPSASNDPRRRRKA